MKAAFILFASDPNVMRQLSFIFALLISTIAAAQSDLSVSKKHDGWLPCLVIAGGDTTQTRVAPKNDYSSGDSYMRILLPNGKVKRLNAADISQLWIPWKRDTIRYISLKDNSVYGATLYRIMVDGPCRLLYNESFANTGGVNLKTYYIFYKGFIQEAQMEAEGWKTLGAVRRFEKAATDLLKDCPQLASEVANLHESSLTIRDVIRHFNQCLSAKQF